MVVPLWRELRERSGSTDDANLIDVNGHTL